MMKRTAMQLRRQPGVTARPWSQWDNFRKMQKLVATGSYRPPEWYYAMRVAPPPHRAYKDPTRRVPLEAPHQEVQERLAKDHPDVAAIGRRVFNNFWMEKPVEKMAHQYEMLRAQGQSKQEAYATVSEECRKVMRVVGRQQQIMAHEAKQSGASMTLREAQGLLKAVNFMQQNAQTLREMDYKGLETAINEKVVRDMTHKYGDKDNLWSLGDRAATRGKSTWAPGRAPEPKPEQGGA